MDRATEGMEMCVCMYACVAVTVVLPFTWPSKPLLSFSVSFYFCCFDLSSSVESLNL